MYCLLPLSQQLWRKLMFCFVSVLKKVKHRLVENMSSGTADALGLSRAILCNGEIIIISIVIILVDV